VRGAPGGVPGQSITERASFEETDKFLQQWSAVEHRREETERARHLGFFVDLEDDGDAGPWNRPRRRGDA
jgi:hypothetical protein